MDVVVGPGTCPGFKNATGEGVDFGAVLGRYAGRLRSPSICDFLDTANKCDLTPLVPGFSKPEVYENGNWAKVAWTASTNAFCDNGDGKTSPCIKFSYKSPAGEGGFPSEVVATVTYTLTDKNELIVDYDATNGEYNTILNPTS
jgi:aldose 1-epimerase